MNKSFVSGRFVGDPIIRYLTSGAPCVNFAIASNDSYFNKEGKKVEHTEYHAAVAFDKLAELIAQHGKKGHGVMIEGHLKTRKYPHKEYPIDLYKTEIHVDKVEFPILPPKSESSSNVGMRSTNDQDASFDRGSAPGFDQ